MCGITGMVTWQEDVARYQADLKRMQAVLSNRGPDQQGIYQDTHLQWHTLGWQSLTWNGENSR